MIGGEKPRGVEIVPENVCNVNRGDGTVNDSEGHHLNSDSSQESSCLFRGHTQRYENVQSISMIACVCLICVAKQWRSQGDYGI